MDEKKLKKEFLRSMGGWESICKKSKDAKIKWALANSIIVSVRRNPTYSPKATMGDRQKFREEWKIALQQAGKSYARKVSDKIHMAQIEKIAGAVSRNHGKTLIGKTMRIGTSQQALNLYLKYLWCLGEISCPPHCPFSRIILETAGITGKWTELKSIKKYEKWIILCRKVAGKESLAMWELENY